MKRLRECVLLLVMMHCASCSRVETGTPSGTAEGGLLAGIVIPRIVCEDSTVQDAVEQIAQEMVKVDQAVGIVLVLSSNASPVRGSDPFLGLSRPPLTLSGVYTNVPLPKLLNEICKQSGLVWRLETNVVIIAAPPFGDGDGHASASVR